jgi:DNA-binding transcriptional LysR family regulator
MDWDDYRFFLMVARTPSIRAAGMKLGVSHSTVLRRLDRLENMLGARLFERNAVGFRLTRAGEDVVDGVRDIEESVQAIDRAVTGRDSVLEGVVKISMPDVFTHPALLPNFVLFKSQFPNIQPEIDLNYSFADLGKREADIAIRLTDNPGDDLVGRKVGQAKMAAYATQSYIDRENPLDEDSSAQVIAYGNPHNWEPRHGLDHLSVVGFFDNIPLQVTLAKQGLGVASLPCMIADNEPSLVCISEPQEFGGVWVLYHTDLRYTSRVRAVRDFLVESLQKKFSG